MRTATSVLFASALSLVACGGAPRVVRTSPRVWERVESPTTESLRGLVALPDAIWASGAHGAVLRSTDDGAHFALVPVPGAEALDFRNLAATDAMHAMALSAGSPARAFVTDDGGARWRETFTREGEGVFYDSLVLRGADGFAVGDPLPSADDARFALLTTHDGGATWQASEGPRANEGEAAFAASNGCIAWPAPDALFFASGGRVFRSHDGASWESANVPVVTSPSTGVFAIAFRTAEIGFATGGDYAAPTTPGVFARTRDGGASWQARTAPRGYRSSVAVDGDTIVVVGTSGSDISYDEAETWTPLDDTALNAVRIASGHAIAVGPSGTIARLAL
jgi:photosystem II stability/assembly factor-like uncharacterized protein